MVKMQKYRVNGGERGGRGKRVKEGKLEEKKHKLKG